MKKRVAYIGISYPLLYDYDHQAKRCSNDLSDSPNPIIESPLGLITLFDELLFLCRSLCPNNMRNLPYVKFVDELYPDFYFTNIAETAYEMEKSIFLTNHGLRFNDIVKAMHIDNWTGLDTHTHGLQLGDIHLSASSNEYHFLFDMYVFEALQQIYNEDIELIANSMFNIGTACGGTQAELTDKIIISQIPNYIGVDGPYHSCMEELRENEFIKDFRKWIVKNHGNLQHSEIQEICVGVERNIGETQDRVLKKYLQENSGFAFFRSTGSTLIKTVLGTMCSSISIVDAFAGSIKKGKHTLDAKSIRWQGFVVDSRKIVQKIR